MFERYTERARQVIVLAQDEAKKLHHNWIGTEHIFYGLCAEGEGVAFKALEEHDITAVDVHRALQLLPKAEEVEPGQLPFVQPAKKLLESALREALSLGHNYVGTEHILLGLMRNPDGAIMNVLMEREVDSEAIRDTVLRLLCGPTGPSKISAGVVRSDRPREPDVVAYRRGWNDGYNAGIREAGR